MLRTVYFTFTKKSVVLWKGAMLWRYSYSYSIDSHPYTLGQIQLAAASASNTSPYQTCVIGWKPLFCLMIIPASDIHSTLLGSQSLMHSLNGQRVPIVSRNLFCRKYHHESRRKSQYKLQMTHSAEENIYWHQ